MDVPLLDFYFENSFEVNLPFFKKVVEEGDRIRGFVAEHLRGFREKEKLETVTSEEEFATISVACVAQSVSV